MASNSFFVVDCESVGLYGQSFLVAYVWVNRNGEKIKEGIIGASSHEAIGTQEGHQWVKDNICIDWGEMRDEKIETFGGASLRELRAIFWEVWLKARKTGAYMAADCCFPVETTFISEAVKDDILRNQWLAPYPFLDIGTLLLACGKNPTEKFPRMSDELPEHNPLMDARQSARILIECLNTLRILDD